MIKFSYLLKHSNIPFLYYSNASSVTQWRANALPASTFILQSVQTGCCGFNHFF